MLALASSEVARPFFPNAPAEAFQVFLNKNLHDDDELRRGSDISEYKPLTKKVARIYVRLKPDVMAPILKAIREEEIAKQNAQLREKQLGMERGMLNWNTLCLARLLEFQMASDSEENALLTTAHNGTDNERGKSDNGSKTTSHCNPIEFNNVEAEEHQNSKGTLCTETLEINSVVTDGTVSDDADDANMPLPQPLAPEQDGGALSPPKPCSDVLPLAVSRDTRKAEMLKVLQNLPVKQLSFQEYDPDSHGPRIHMHETIEDRVNRRVLMVSLRGNNFTQTKDVEMHEDSVLLHLFLAVKDLFGLPMVHLESTQLRGAEDPDNIALENCALDCCEDRNTGTGDKEVNSKGQAGTTLFSSSHTLKSTTPDEPCSKAKFRMCARPAVLIRRSWAQFAASLPEYTQGMDILKLDTIGCPSSEWKKEEKFGSLMDPRNWFKKIISLGIVDSSRSGTVVVNDLRPNGARLDYDNALTGRKTKPGFLEA